MFQRIPRSALIITGLVFVVGILAFLLVRAFSPGDGGENGGDGGEEAGIRLELPGLAAASAGGPAGDGRLSISLSLGQEQPSQATPIALAQGTPLAPADVDAVLARLPALTPVVTDTQDFRLPDESLPPPRTGETVTEPFPPPVEEGTPPPVAGEPLEVLRYAPEGDVDIVPFLSVTFNQPMVPLATLEDLAAEDVPVDLTPALPGVWRWVGTKTLTFSYDPGAGERFPMATTYRAEIAAGTTSASGGVLAETVSWTFTTPPPQVTTFVPNGAAVERDPLIFIAFDQRIDPAAVLATIEATADGRTVSLHLADDAAINADKRVSRLVANASAGQWLVARAQEPLPAAANINVTIGPGTPSAEGPLTTTERQSYSFSTYAPLRIDEHRCGWNECPPFAPFYINFNNPLDQESFTESMVDIEPALPSAVVRVSGSNITIQGATKGRTTYRVTLDGTIQDIFGQTLGDSETLTFRVGSAPSGLVGPDHALVTLDPAASTPYFNVYVINYDRVQVRAYTVTPDDWPAYQDYRQNYNDEDPPTPPGELVINEEIATDAADDVLTEVSIDLSDALDGDTGHLVVVVTPEESILSRLRDRRREVVQAWVQVTRIGIDAFVDYGEMVAWTTDLRDGTPLPGTALRLGSVDAVSGSDGVARFDLPAAGAGYLVASRDGDIALLPSTPYYWDDDGWRPRPPSDDLRWYVFDDRQLYRPGEEVHVKGWVRRVGGREDGDVALPGRETSELSYSVMGSQGNELAQGSATINALGGFDLTFTLPENANLGHASLVLNTTAGGNVGSTQFYHDFQIQEFRRPEFEVSARNETTGPYFVGGDAVVAVSATYYAGGPLPGAEVTWNVASSPSIYTPPGWSDFIFGKWQPWWWYGGPVIAEAFSYEPGFGGPVSGETEYETFSGTTDASGNHYLRLNFDAADRAQPYSVLAEAAVMDVNRQAWAATTSLLVHPADLYVGLRSERTFVELGTPLAIEAIVTDLDGNAIAGRQIVMRAARLEWRFGPGDWREEEVEVQTCTVTSAADPVTCSFTTEKGGTYQITATVTDDQGRKNESQFTRWVSGGQRPAARNVEQEAVTLIPDRDSYQPGDVAEILVQSPFSPAEGLLTVARSGILYTERFSLSGDTHTLQIPIADAHIPNLNVQVDLVGATPRTGANGEPLPDVPERPAFATGNLSLSIPPLTRALELDVSPRATALAPGEETVIDVAVRDASGRPVPDAELALVVVDEAILALTNYQLADPLSVFYLNRPPAFSSMYARDQIVLVRLDQLGDQLDADLAAAAMPTAGAVAEEGEMMAEAPMEEPAAAEDSAGNRAGAAPEPIRVRSNFNPLAVFAPAVRTDAAGKAEVNVQLPDNLTRYRVMVVAVAGDKQFGSGEANLTARLPLMVRPSAPRFLNFGDQFELPVVLQNQTDEPMTVDVVVQATNLTLTDALDGATGARVEVPANDRVEVRFPATTASVGTVRLQIAAVAGPYADAAALSLPVYTPATTEAFATYGVLDEGAVQQPLLPPTGVFPQFGGLEIQTSSTALQALTDAVLYLTSYRYECSEQLASRILGVAALRDVLSAFDAAGLPSPAEMEAAVTRDIEKLQGLQNGDGGFPVWTRGRESVPFYTIHVTNALLQAQAKGFDVPAETVQRAVDYLRDIESHYPPWYGEAIRRTLTAYAIHVRWLADDAAAADAADLLHEAGLDGLSLEAIAWLWPVLNADGGYADDVSAIDRYFNNRAVETASAANFTTAYGDDGYLLLHSNRRTDALILDALIRIRPESDLIPKVVNGLLAHRTRGRWDNTQENVFVLLALDRYFNTFESQTPDFVARIWLGETYVGDHAYAGRTTERHATEIPMNFLVDGEAAPQDLILSKEGTGRLYYRLGLSYAPDDLYLDPLAMGFVVERSYEAMDDPEDVYRDEDGTWHIRAGARVRVRLTMVAENRRYHVALVDPLPAGLEIVNPALAVSQNLPPDPQDSAARYRWWWWTWYEHQNMRDERAEVFTTLLWDGVYNYTYTARATTPGTFVVPPAKAEEMYSPEVFGRSASDWVIVE